MPAHKTYLIRRLSFGHMFTVISTSPAAAMTEFMGRYPGAEPGEDFMIKERGVGSWIATYRVGKGGSLRKLPG